MRAGTADANGHHMLVGVRSPLPEVCGFASHGFERVRDAFVENFARRH